GARADRARNRRPGAVARGPGRRRACRRCRSARRARTGTPGAPCLMATPAHPHIQTSVSGAARDGTTLRGFFGVFRYSRRALELDDFEDSEFYDKLTRARREASTRPLSLVTRTFGLVQNGISLVSYGVLLARFSSWAVAVLLLAGLPAFVAEAKFSGDAFRLFRWRSPETRMQIYLETVIAREDHAKEVKLYGLGPRLLERYRDIFRRLYREDRSLTMRRD